jgi:POT family proton-dependent oligopeptide transporter
MSHEFGGSAVNQQKVLGHPVGLFVLFFTEMWERFSYYGMRAILVLFLTSTFMDGGWEWPRENALALLGTYASLVYLTPIMGGYIADRIIGYRWAVVIGATIMTLGHASMALETPTFLYIGLACLVIGNGFFKPNMTSIISEMYKDHPEKKDGAYTIFYMGVNAGAFLGIMLCGYLGEKVGWSYGFGLAGIFMFLGMLQFYFAQNIFGEIGKKPAPAAEREVVIEEGGKEVPFTTMHKVMIAVMSFLGLIWIFNDPYSKITGNNMLDFNLGGVAGADFTILLALIMFLGLVIMRLMQYTPIVRDRMIAVVVFAFFTVFFWASFEQAAGSMTIFARDYTSRALEGSAATAFTVINTLLTIVPLGIITWVLWMMFQRVFGHYPLSNIILGTSFVIIWGIVIWMLQREYASENTEVAASWFSILNSLFIITFAPLFSKIWESKYNPSASIKYAVGLTLLGIGFAALAYGASGIPQGAQTAAVSMVWLIFAYLFHTLGELCLSPVGLSYVSKLVPARMIAFMFGIWYLAIAIGNKLAHLLGSKIDTITAQYSLSSFFLIFTIVPILGGVILVVINPILKKLMHGIH